MPFQLVYTGLMGSISSPAMGGFKYVRKVTDEFTKYKEIYLIQIKDEASRRHHSALRTAGGGAPRGSDPGRSR